MPPWPTIHDTEPMLTIEPPPAAFIIGWTAWAAKNWCRRLVAKRSSQYSGVTVSHGWRSSRAALLTSTVIGPCASAASATARRSAAISRRSQARNSGRPCPAASISATSASLASRARSRNATREPCSQKRRTIWAPMPEPPPVTSTERPSGWGRRPTPTCLPPARSAAQPPRSRACRRCLAFPEAGRVPRKDSRTRILAKIPTLRCIWSPRAPTPFRVLTRAPRFLEYRTVGDLVGRPAVGATAPGERVRAQAIRFHDRVPPPHPPNGWGDFLADVTPHSSAGFARTRPCNVVQIVSMWQLETGVGGTTRAGCRFSLYGLGAPFPEAGAASFGDGGCRWGLHEPAGSEAHAR